MPYLETLIPWRMKYGSTTRAEVSISAMTQTNILQTLASA